MQNINILDLAINTSVYAGREIMRIYNDPSQDFGIEMKADNSPLTLADKASHECIVERLKPSGYPILSEEGVQIPYEERKDWHRLWIVDPLDGTKEFIKRNGEFTVNIALIEDGRPILGIIFAPTLGTVYGGIVGWGARRVEGINLDDLDVPVTQRKEPLTFYSLPQQAMLDHMGLNVVASRSHMNPETEEYITKLREANTHPVNIVSKGSSLKMCLVAEGSADVYPRFAPTMEWDTAAGDAICRACGKQVLDYKTGLPLTYNKQDLHNPWFIVK
ncbi:MAG: 3'(2'),5'-bisphosphate nucleotidase CysQ [Bacteroidaceae bacterium]|nr:3'(2'),5'-bisphosphate nucleotidase CysQ [Bacteroidaceae bacterium]